MYERLLTLSRAAVGLGLVYCCLRTTAAVLLFGARGAATLWRLARCRQRCPDCRRLGERCPWCDDDARRALVGALVVLLPVAAWPLMLRSPVEFDPRTKWAAGLWAAVWLALGSALLSRGGV
jgi:hypothetical protein